MKCLQRIALHQEVLLECSVRQAWQALAAVEGHIRPVYTKPPTTYYDYYQQS